MSKGVPLNVLGDTVTVLATGEETGGAVAAALVEARPGGGPPPHTHAQAELFHVLDGALELFVETGTRTLRAGETGAVAGGVLHTYRNASGEPVRFIATCAPAGLELFFAEVAKATGDGPPDLERVLEIATAHGMTFPQPAPA